MYLLNFLTVAQGITSIRFPLEDNITALKFSFKNFARGSVSVLPSPKHKLF